ncbi:MAG TPA: Nif3-like dinuclear metal center hexameric protein, partial [Thermodesulfovibrionales bacterium]|nr:Nif3-like dinuclear metal center hexameric protein [Thermodesulfovibrionales bacterium]
GAQRVSGEQMAGMKRIPLRQLVSFLDHELRLSEFPHDDSANGLQVEGAGQVRKIGLAVDACAHVFREAAEKKADFLIVHHGLIWGGVKSVTGVMKKRIQTLLDADISLYACHLPLDWHPEYGNNSRLLKALSIRRMGEFGEYHGKRIGCWGRLAGELSLEEFGCRVNKALNTEAMTIGFGKKVRNVGIVSGGGWSAIYDAEKIGVDTLLVGEPAHSAYTLAEEMKVNLVFAGHYATETLGVRAVGDLLRRKFGLTIAFLDHPTGL